MPELARDPAHYQPLPVIPRKERRHAPQVFANPCSWESDLLIRLDIPLFYQTLR